MTYDWKINGEIRSSSAVILESPSNHSDMNTEERINIKDNERITYFSLDYGKDNWERKDFVLLITENNSDKKNKSRVYLGYDSKDNLNPYASLIRFSPLISINPDESN